MPAAVACVFDAYGTLLDVDAALAAESAALGRERAVELSALWRRKQLEYSWLRSLMRRHADFWQVTQDSLDFALQALNLEDAALRSRLLAAYRQLAPYPEVPAMLRALQRHGVRTAILSNGSPDMLRDAVQAAGIADLLDEVLSVEEVGVFKPAPEVYRLATTRLGLAAPDIVFLSSNGWDVHGAASFGFRTVWVNRMRAPDERLPGEPVRAIAGLDELPGFLGLATDDAVTGA
ncbi:haloacid dehalogenase type II [Benzoatithermus flavus]|uniref:(S)-2-haloacid dehalogenase n=1 Tax=Benzoatithermus flavus TaxID=3108223 RepID=A0ABU8XVN4_9PROT